jgi:hypothetical protein
MDFQKVDDHGFGPVLDQPAVLVILAALFVLFVWRAFRRPRLPGWSFTRRSK